MNIKSYWLVAFIMCAFASCSKLIDVGQPKEQTVSETVFQGDASATSAVYGIYSNIMTGSGALYAGSGLITVNTGLSSDELLFTGTDQSYTEIYTNSISILNTRTGFGLWAKTYELIFQINSCIEGLNNSSSVTANTKSQLLGECKFWRAFFYFNMSQLFGEVPLELTTDYRVNAVMGRTDTAKIANQIIDDLTDAVKLMTESNFTKAVGRADKYAAMALLSKMYLYKQRWSDAERISDQIISSGSFQVLDNLDNVFLANSNECILQLIPVNNYYVTIEGGYLVPYDNETIPDYIINPSLYNSFENNDKRKDHWISFNNIANAPNDTTTYYFPFKYKINNSPIKSEYYSIFRIAEMYLIRAESRAKQNNLSGAISDVDVIRNRASLPLISVTNPSISASDLLAVIQHERRIELFCEWGNRWYDLKRTGTASQVLSTVKPSWNKNAVLYPVPDDQRKINLALSQNEGY